MARETAASSWSLSTPFGAPGEQAPSIETPSVAAMPRTRPGTWMWRLATMASPIRRKSARFNARAARPPQPSRPPQVLPTDANWRRAMSETPHHSGEALSIMKVHPILDTGVVVASAAQRPDGRLDDRHSAYYDNVSPPLSWTA